MGPNTGGMGAYAPAPCMTSKLIKQAQEEIIFPTLKALKDKGHPYKGVLYAGLMLTHEGPKLIEYNVRFGDPECQILMMLMEEDLGKFCLEVATDSLKSKDLTTSSQTAICIVMAADGYPGSYDKGTLIKGVNNCTDEANGKCVFHAGTKKTGEDWQANGGRVLNICASASNFTEAHAKAYSSIKTVEWPEGFYRTDIGKSAL